MYRFMLDAAETFDWFDPERMASAVGVLVQGILTVFAVLCIVWFALVLIRIFMYDIPNKRAKKDEAPAVVTPAPAPVAAPVQTDDALLVAIITAAISAMREGEGEGDTGFRVVSFNRTKK